MARVPNFLGMDIEPHEMKIITQRNAMQFQIGVGVGTEF